MRHTLVKTLLTVLISTLVWSCSDDTQFRVEGVVEGLGTRNITLTYVADGHLEQKSMVAIDGKFSLTGSSKDYTIAELTASDRHVIARMLVRNGETLKCRLDKSAPENNEITGNTPSEQWCRFLSENADSLAMPGVANALIARYVGAHTGNILSSALMLTQFDARLSQLEADSLIGIIKPEARPESLVDGYRYLLSTVNSGAVNAEVKSFTLESAGDSTERYYPVRFTCTMLAFTGGDDDRRDTIVPLLRRLRTDFNGQRLHIVEVSSAPDSAAWRRSIAADSATWTQVWAPAVASYAPFEPLQLPYFPFYVVSDSIGRVMYRGASAKEAGTKASEYIKTRINAR